MREFFPLLRVFNVLNAGRVSNTTDLLQALWKSTEAQPQAIENLTTGLFSFVPGQSIRMPYPASESCV